MMDHNLVFLWCSVDVLLTLLLLPILLFLFLRLAMPGVLQIFKTFFLVRTLDFLYGEQCQESKLKFLLCKGLE